MRVSYIVGIIAEDLYERLRPASYLAIPAWRWKHYRKYGLNVLQKCLYEFWLQYLTHGDPTKTHNGRILNLDGWCALKYFVTKLKYSEYPDLEFGCNKVIYCRFGVRMEIVRSVARVCTLLAKVNKEC